MLQQATKRVLNLQLKELEEHGIVCKELFHEIPLRVEYSLTPLGKSLLTVIHAMTHWGNQHREFLEPVINKGEELITESQDSLPCQGTSTILP
jgi:DNA-binding HxlR family transcriptional regulator